jgi:hypothetical protein
LGYYFSKKKKLTAPLKSGANSKFLPNLVTLLTSQKGKATDGIISGIIFFGTIPVDWYNKASALSLCHCRRP